MKNKLLIGIISIGTIAATTASVYAFNPDIKDSIKEALANNDYAAWSEAIADSPRAEEMLATIDETNFDKLVEAHNLMEAGNKEGAKAIMEELGLDTQFQKGKHDGKFDPEQMQAVKDALDNNDYQAWVDAISQVPMGERFLEVIDESNFDRLVEAHQLRTQSQEIMDELGLPQMDGKGNKKHNGPKDKDHLPASTNADFNDLA
ncbi:hypothetical protein KJ855_00370 [Patescibacteria group bacterium]|nr:hypothetical protein [Patescibacteria group bacterium]